MKISTGQEKLKLSLWKKYVTDHDLNAFGELYSLYHNRLTLYCLGKLKNRELAENAASETLEKLLQFKNPDEIMDFESWLFKVAKNTCYSMFTKANRRNQLLSEEKTGLREEYIQPEAEKNLESEDMESFIRKTLNETDYRIWQLYQMGFENEEIGEQVGMNAKTVANRKSEARNKLRKSLMKIRNKRK